LRTLYLRSLVLEEKLGDYDGSPFTADSPKQIAITRLP